MNNVNEEKIFQAWYWDGRESRSPSGVLRHPPSYSKPLEVSSHSRDNLESLSSKAAPESINPI